MTRITVHKAKTNLSKILAEVESGAEIVICRGEQPVARIIPFRTLEGRRPRVGEITSPPIQAKKGCFAPLSDVALADWGL